MAAAYQDLYLEQGTTYNEQITLTDQNGAAYNLSNFSVSSQARKSYYSANASIVFNTTIFNANSGIIQLSLDSATCANVSPGKYVYDVIVIATIGTPNVTRVLEGQVIITPDVTR